MKKMDELMSELGFNSKAPTATKEAFLKHLMKTTTGVNYQTPSEKKNILAGTSQDAGPVQLSFDLDAAIEDAGSKSA